MKRLFREEEDSAHICQNHLRSCAQRRSVLTGVSVEQISGAETRGEEAAHRSSCQPLWIYLRRASANQTVGKLTTNAFSLWWRQTLDLLDLMLFTHTTQTSRHVLVW